VQLERISQTTDRLW